MAELLEARGRANSVHEMITATTFTHVQDPDALGADFFSQVVLTASLQVLDAPSPTLTHDPGDSASVA